MIGDELGEIFVLYVDPQMRNRGIGTKILDAITQQQKAWGAKEQWVSVQKGNQKGTPFYEAKGFSFQHERESYGNVEGDWDKGCLWIIGTPLDRFPSRITKNPKCAIGIVDFDLESGKVLHAGFRGKTVVKPFDKGIAIRLLTRYLGRNEATWDPRFRNLDDRNVLICFKPETVVVRDQSFLPAKMSDG